MSMARSAFATASGTLSNSASLANIREGPTRYATLAHGLSSHAGAMAGWVVPVALLLVWELVVQLRMVPAHQLPPPSSLAVTAWALLQDGTLLRHTSVSGARVLSGFITGALLALLVGSLVALVRPAERLLDSTFQGLRAVPSLAWVPLLLLWFGIDEAPKLILIAIGTFFPVYLATYSGLGNVDRKLVEVGRQAGLSRQSLLWRILIPAALPGIFTGLRAALSLGWMFLVAAELIASTQGLGYLLSDGRETGRVDLVFIAILSLALMGKISDSLLRAIERRVLAWRDVADLQESP